ncbi:MAG: CDP-diacylglycerol--glycerol-3-phosphate 3-phosphatidyltransferase [Spirochaetaceae bacterium]
MNWPNRLTVLRIILSPIFFVFYFLPEWSGTAEVVSVVIVVVLFIAIELSDALDGYIARRFNLVSDIGKVIDPFADVMSRMTYFFCFTMSGLMPSWVFLIIIYRELGVIFLRLMMIRKGVAMAASIWGKLKAITYAAGGILGVAYFVITTLPLELELIEGVVRTTVVTIFVLGALASVLSFLSYIVKALPSLKESS